MKFVKVDASESLDAFAQEHSRTLLKRLDAHNGKYKFKMTMKPGARRKDGQVKNFEVVGVIAIRGSGELRANKTDADPKKAVLSVVTALEKQIRRWTEKRERSRSTVGKSLKPVRAFKMEISG